MIVLAVAILSLVAASTVVGALLLPHGAPDRRGDRSILATWLGLPVVAAGLAAIALVSPLASWRVPIAASVLLAGVALSPRARRRIRAALPARGGPVLLAGAILLAAAALVGAQRVPWGDVGLYHAQAIQWLARYGAVPGVALIQTRLGTTSPWFALAAPFDFGPWRGRTDPIPGVLLLALLLGQLTVVAARAIAGRARRADWFLGWALLGLLPVFRKYFAASPSPDFAVAMLAVMAAWSFLLIAEGDGDASRETGPVPRAAIPLLLGAGAAATKLTGAPVLAVAGVFWLLHARPSTPARVASAWVVPAFLLGTTAALGIVTSGCPFYPLRAGCLDLPWSVPAGPATEYRDVVLSGYGWKLQGAHAAGPLAAVSWLVPWAQKNWAVAVLAGLVLAYAVSALLPRRRGMIRRDGRRYVLLLAACGTVVVVANSPIMRFLAGYVVLVPALLLADVCCRLGASRARNRPARRLSRWVQPVIAGALAAAVLVPTSLVNPRSLLAGRLRYAIDPHAPGWLAPRPLPQQIPLTYRTVNDVRFAVPIATPNRVLNGYYCWAVPVPCTPELTYPRIRLRAPARGIGAGFVSDRNRSSASDST